MALRIMRELCARSFRGMTFRSAAIAKYACQCLALSFFVHVRATGRADEFPNARSAASGCPGLPEISNRLALVVKHVLREMALPIFTLPRLGVATPFDDFSQFAFKRYGFRLAASNFQR